MWLALATRKRQGAWEMWASLLYSRSSIAETLRSSSPRGIEKPRMMSFITCGPSPGRQKQEAHESKASLGYRRSYLRAATTKAKQQQQNCGRELKLAGKKDMGMGQRTQRGTHRDQIPCLPLLNPGTTSYLTTLNYWEPLIYFL